MACVKTAKQINLQLDCEGVGYETEQKAKEAGVAKAREKIRSEGDCPGACDHPGGQCIRIALTKDLENAVDTYPYDDNDRDVSYGWSIDKQINTHCVCAMNA